MELAVAAMFMVVAILNFSIGLWVLLPCYSCSKHRSFFIFSTGVALWIGGMGAVMVVPHHFFFAIVNIGGVGILFGIGNLAWSFLPYPSIKNLQFFWNLPAIPALIIAAYPGLLIQSATYASGHLIPVQGPWFPFYTIAFSVYFVATLLLLYKAYQYAKPAARAQLHYFFLGIGAFVLIAVMCNLILPAFGIFFFNQFGPLASIISVAATAYAIVRYHLLDIRIVIQQGIVGSFCIGGTVAVYALLVAGTSFALHTSDISSGLIAGLVTTIIGISAAPYIERSLKRLINPLLFKDSQDYTQALQHQQAFFDDISHALQSPLTVIASGIESLTHEKRASRHATLCGIIRRNTQTLSTLVQNILTISRLEAKALPRSEHINLSELISECLESICVIADAHAIKVSATIQSHVFITGDVDEIRHACMNIAGNAVQYTKNCPTRSIVLELSTQGSSALLRITDSGIGMDAEHIARLGERFYRGPTKTLPPGTGIGVAYATCVIARHGGTLTYTSTPNVGTTATVSLPLLVTEES